MAVLGKLKDKVASKADAVSELLVTGAKDKAQDVVQNTIGEINALGAVLANSGFLIGDIVLAVGVLPKFIVAIEQQEDGTAEFDKLLASEGLTKTQSSVIKALQQIYGLKEVVEPQGYTFGQIDIELGVTPAVSVHLISTKSRAFHTEAREE